MEFLNLEDEIYIEKQNRHDFDNVVHIFDEWIECEGISNNYDSYWVTAYGNLMLNGVHQKITITCQVKHFNTKYEIRFEKGRLMEITRIE